MKIVDITRTRLFQQRSQTRLIRFDEQPVSMAELDDLSPDLWERFRTPRSDDDREVLLRKLGIASADDDGTLRTDGCWCADGLG